MGQSLGGSSGPRPTSFSSNQDIRASGQRVDVSNQASFSSSQRIEGSSQGSAFSSQGVSSQSNQRFDSSRSRPADSQQRLPRPQQSSSRIQQESVSSQQRFIANQQNTNRLSQSTRTSQQQQANRNQFAANSQASSRSQFQNNRQSQSSRVQGSNNAQFNSNSQLQSSEQSFSIQNQEEVSGVFEPLNLPSGATRLLGDISTSFTCVDQPYGYYADQQNNCRVFHICYPALFSDEHVETYQYSFMCGEGTRFDQKEMTCVKESDAIACNTSPEFYYRNTEFGLPQEKTNL